MSLYDTEGRDVAIETVDNGDNTFDVAFVPESVGQVTAKIFFADVEIPDSPFTIDVQPRLPVERTDDLHQPDSGLFLSVCVIVVLYIHVLSCLLLLLLIY